MQLWHSKMARLAKIFEKNILIIESPSANVQQIKKKFWRIWGQLKKYNMWSSGLMVFQKYKHYCIPMRRKQMFKTYQTHREVKLEWAWKCPMLDRDILDGITEAKLKRSLLLENEVLKMTGKLTVLMKLKD